MEITSIASFLDYYERVRERTMKVAKVIPPDAMNWAYKPGKFTIADVLRHIAAIERYMFVENVAGRPSRYVSCGPELADGYEQVFAFMDTMHAESVAIIKTLHNEELNRKCTTPGGTQIAVWKWLRAMVEHEIQHRGELYIYLNLLDVKTPPMYGLSAEEVAARGINN